jgi:hypothetical protein
VYDNKTCTGQIQSVSDGQINSPDVEEHELYFQAVSRDRKHFTLSYTIRSTMDTIDLKNATNNEHGKQVT